MKELAIAHTDAQFDLFKDRGLIPADTKQVKSATALRGVIEARIHLLPDWKLRLRSQDVYDVEYMVGVGLFDVEHHGEPVV